MRKRSFLWAVEFGGLAALQSLWIAPQLLRLPADYADETRYVTTTRFRDRLTDPWTNGNVVGRRVDLT